MIELYGMGSPNVRKIAIMLEEIGAPYNFRRVDVFQSGQFAPAFTQLNPNRKVPVIVDHEAAGGAPVTIFESGAILIYLAEKYRALLPAGEPQRSTVLQWLMIQTSNIGPLLGQLNHFTFGARAGNDYAYGRYHREAKRLYTLLDQRLATSANLGGDAYSIADIATYPWSLYLEKHRFDAADFPALSAWRDNVGARPAVQRGFATIAKIEKLDQEAMATASAEDLDRFFGRATA
jgi:GST-like protein